MENTNARSYNGEDMVGDSLLSQVCDEIDLIQQPGAARNIPATRRNDYNWRLVFEFEGRKFETDFFHPEPQEIRSVEEVLAGFCKSEETRPQMREFLGPNLFDQVLNDLS